MTATLDGVTKKKAEPTAEQAAALELVRLAKEQGLSLTGPDGLLKQLTKTVIETSLNEEMTEHLGYEKHDPAGAGTGNIRNGTGRRRCSPTRRGTSRSTCPAIGRERSSRRSSKTRRRRLNGADQVVLSSMPKGMTTGEISASLR